MPAKGAGQAQAKRPPLKLVYGQLVQPAERNRMGYPRHKHYNPKYIKYFGGNNMDHCFGHNTIII